MSIDRQELIALLDLHNVGRRITKTNELASYRETLADAVEKLADSTRRNIPRGLYRNSQGVDLKVMGYVAERTGVDIGIRTLGGDIAYAEFYDDLFKTTTPVIVTEDSLRACGYELVNPEETPAPDVADSGTTFPELKTAYGNGMHYTRTGDNHPLTECNKHECGPKL